MLLATSDASSFASARLRCMTRPLRRSRASSAGKQR
jgi:hypothetical protein